MAVKGQENPGKKGLLQSMGKVWKFHFEFRENLHLWKKSGKRGISSKHKVVHLVFHDERWWHFPFFDVDYVQSVEQSTDSWPPYPFPL